MKDLVEQATNEVKLQEGWIQQMKILGDLMAAERAVWKRSRNSCKTRNWSEINFPALSSDQCHKIYKLVSFDEVCTYTWGWV